MVDKDMVTGGVTNLVGIVQVVALISTFGFFISGSATCMKIHRQKSVKNVNFLPYLTALLNCFLWCVYGTMKNDALLIFVNGSGCVFQAVYIFIFVQNCANKGLYLKQLTAVILPAMILLYALQIQAHFSSPIDILGWIAVIVTVLMFGSPLSTLRTVVQTRNSETISLPLSAMTIFVTGSWFTYGYLIHDAFVQGPNLMGLMLGVIQVYLFQKYKHVSRAGYSMSV